MRCKVAVVAVIGVLSWGIVGQEISTQDSSTKGEQRIVGGKNAEEPYPYQISLQVFVKGNKVGPFGRDDGYRHNCGGSIINDYYVVTAAHCVEDYSVDRLEILAGTSKLDSGGERYKVDNYLIHPDYEVLNTSDIALIRTTEPFNFSNPNIGTIDYNDEYIGGGVECVLTGWGYTTPIRIGNPPNDLQEVYVPTITNEQCREEGMSVNPTEICTKSEKLFTGACGGDSGGPLAIKERNLLVGIVSYGTIICAIGSPDVFTRASAFKEWIDENSQA
ncbi:chymotrypsin-1-like [Lutzomyia longipalpis]|uniref:chymotrypsin-1-like n=1 Tax=Lutzomyia longipalpis TaxID=7200 RepID=UPI00248379D6|nr:chymotrypsin-1-like [Lutzomyia longipalpis]